MIDLIVVMPIYNEEDCIVKVIKDWNDELSKKNISYQILAINDGSTDGTLRELKSLNLEHCRIVDKQNSGHGPSVLHGYHLAIESNARWIFQCDSDDEMEAKHFSLLWDLRSSNDAVIGIRKNRDQSFIRSFVSMVSRQSIGLIYKRGVKDVNAPYRLINATVLERILKNIPATTFAPNIAVSGLLAFYSYAIENVAIPHTFRKTGTVSITDLNVFKVAAEALRQTIGIRLRMKSIDLKESVN